MISKRLQLVTVLLLVLTLGTISVSGVMQSVNKISSSGVVIKAVPQPVVTPPYIPSPQPSTPEPVKNIEVYDDPQCTNPVSEITWGQIEAGTESTVTLYLKNTGETSVTLALTSQNWNPEILIDHTSLSWDYLGQSFNSGETIPVNIKLSVDKLCPAASGFSFQVVIIVS